MDKGGSARNLATVKVVFIFCFNLTISVLLRQGELMKIKELPPVLAGGRFIRETSSCDFLGNMSHSRQLYDSSMFAHAVLQLWTL